MEEVGLGAHPRAVTGDDADSESLLQHYPAIYPAQRKHFLIYLGTTEKRKHAAAVWLSRNGRRKNQGQKKEKAIEHQGLFSGWETRIRT